MVKSKKDETLKSNPEGENIPSSPNKTIDLGVLNGDKNGQGPGTSNQAHNVSSQIIFEANASNPDYDQSSPRNLSPKARRKNDRPPTNAKPYSPRKPKNYLNYDGDDSDEEDDGALAQVYGRVDKTCFIEV